MGSGWFTIDEILEMGVILSGLEIYSEDAGYSKALVVALHDSSKSATPLCLFAHEDSDDEYYEQLPIYSVPQSLVEILRGRFSADIACLKEAALNCAKEAYGS